MRPSLGLKKTLTFALLCAVTAACADGQVDLSVRARPLPTERTDDGSPSTFISTFQRGAGDLGEHRRRTLELFSTETGAPVRELALTFSNSPTDFDYPSRGPTGDIWFVRTTKGCTAEIVRISASTGKASSVLRRCGLNIRGPVQSPDGRSLAYVLDSRDPAQDSSELVVRDLSSGQERFLLPKDAGGQPGKKPVPYTPPKSRCTGICHGGAVRTPDVPGFTLVPAWSLDSSSVAIGHVTDIALTDVATAAPIVVIRVRDFAQTHQLAPPPHCSFTSVAFDPAGPAVGEDCGVLGPIPLESATLLQFDPTLHTVVRRFEFGHCTSGPQVTAGGTGYQWLLLNIRKWCGEASPDLNHIAVLGNDRLRVVKDYEGPQEPIGGVTW